MRNRPIGCKQVGVDRYCASTDSFGLPVMRNRADRRTVGRGPMTDQTVIRRLTSSDRKSGFRLVTDSPSSVGKWTRGDSRTTLKH